MAKREPLPVPDRALLERAAAGRDVVRYDAGDPELILSLVVWPTDAVDAAQAATRACETTGHGRRVPSA